LSQRASVQSTTHPTHSNTPSHRHWHFTAHSDTQPNRSDALPTVHVT